MSDLSRYPLRVFWSDDDDGFIAEAPDLPGCSAFGASQSEAIDELRDAMKAWIDAAAAAGNPIPAPSEYASEANYSGKFVVRLPRRLHRLAAERAQIEGVSLNQFVVAATAECVGERRGQETGLRWFITQTVDNVVNVKVPGVAWPTKQVATTYDPAVFVASWRSSYLQQLKSLAVGGGKPTDDLFHDRQGLLREWTSLSTDQTTKVANG